MIIDNNNNNNDYYLKKKYPQNNVPVAPVKSEKDWALTSDLRRQFSQCS